VSTIGLLIDVVLICVVVAAAGAVGMVSYRRLPRPDPRPVASERPTGQSTRSAERTALERDIDHEPSVVYALLRMAADDAGLTRAPNAVGAASASKADITELVEKLEAHLGLEGPTRN
jgi:hypothetical protein